MTLGMEKLHIFRYSQGASFGGEHEISKKQLSDPVFVFISVLFEYGRDDAGSAHNVPFSAIYTRFLDASIRISVLLQVTRSNVVAGASL